MKYNHLIPELSVADFNKSLNFYTQILGFKVEYDRLESNFAFLSFQGSQLMIDQGNDDKKVLGILVNSYILEVGYSFSN